MVGCAWGRSLSLGRRPKADELSSPSVKDKPFETCLLQRSGEAWRLWDTRDLRSGPSVALSGGGQAGSKARRRAGLGLGMPARRTLPPILATT